MTLAIAQAEHLSGNDKMLLRMSVRDALDLSRVSAVDLEYILGRRLRSTAWNATRALQLAEHQANQAQIQAWDYTVLGEAAYPQLLAEIADPPFLLWWSAKALAADNLCIGIVGTRNPGEDGRKAAWRLGAECAWWRLVHVSGLAFGIDAAGHAGACQNAGTSLAVLPSGLDCIAPRGNLALARNILAAGGRLVTEYAPGTLAAPWRFVARNRIIAGLAPVLIVVEAPEDSGALISARLALEYNRDVMVHPCGLYSERGAGTRQLREEGARIYSDMGGIVSEYGRWPS